VDRRLLGRRGLSHGLELFRSKSRPARMFDFLCNGLLLVFVGVLCALMPKPAIIKLPARSLTLAIRALRPTASGNDWPEHAGDL